MAIKQWTKEILPLLKWHLKHYFLKDFLDGMPHPFDHWPPPIRCNVFFNWPLRWHTAYSTSYWSYCVYLLSLPFNYKLPGSKDSVSHLPPLLVQAHSWASIHAFYLNWPHIGSRTKRVSNWIVHTSPSAILEISAHFLFL